jgi:hypothetical protein
MIRGVGKKKLILLIRIQEFTNTVRIEQQPHKRKEQITLLLFDGCAVIVSILFLSFTPSIL